jgi:hypothetical protein
MYSRATLPVVVSVFLGAGVLLGPGLAAQDTDPDAPFPNTREHGRAVVEYEDDDLQTVAGYHYSQRNHDSRWLLIQLAMTASSHMKIYPEDISLRHPDGREMPLPPQQLYREDRERVLPLRQNASQTRQNILGFINRPLPRAFSTSRFPSVRVRGGVPAPAQSRPFRFFVEPGDGIIESFFEVDQWRVAWGDLFFSSPTDMWDAGTYALVINGEDGAQAVLPINLN